MPLERTITHFKTVGRRGARIEVHLDGRLWVELDAETVVREHLATGQALDRARRGEILTADEAIRARKAAAAVLAHGPRTAHELRRRLAEKKFSTAAVEAAIGMLEESGTLDDNRAAERVAATQRRRGYGPRRIERELRQRGLDAEAARRCAARAFADVDDLVENCLAAARRAAARCQPLQDARQRRKLSARLARRGWPDDTIRRALERLE